MKRFEFRLERVLKWRKSELETEQARLEKLLQALRQLEHELSQFRAVLQEAEKELICRAEAGEPIDPWRLLAVGSYRQYTRVREQLIGGRIVDLQQQICEQRDRITRAWRRHQLLERLRERAWEQWQVEAGRELEREVNELTILGWGRRSQAGVESGRAAVSSGGPDVDSRFQISRRDPRRKRPGAGVV